MQRAILACVFVAADDAGIGSEALGLESAVDAEECVQQIWIEPKIRRRFEML